MGTYVDFNHVRRQVSIVQVAEWLGLELTPKGNQLRGSCPLHDGGSRALVITPSENIWYCWASECKSGGGTIELVAKIRQLDFRDAAIAIQRHFLPGPGKLPTPADAPLQPLEYLEAKHALVQELGFEEAIARSLGIGYASRGLMRGRVAIPLRDEQGRLTGYVGVNPALTPPVKLPSQFCMLA